MYSVKFRSIKVGLGSIFASLLLLLGLFTLTGTVSAHSHATSARAAIGAACPANQVWSITFRHSRHKKLPIYGCKPDPDTTSSCTGVSKITFHHSHKKEPLSYSCAPGS